MDFIPHMPTFSFDNNKFTQNAEKIMPRAVWSSGLKYETTYKRPFTQCTQTHGLMSFTIESNFPKIVYSLLVASGC